MHASPPRPRLLGRGSWPEARRIGDLLRTETTGGLLPVAAAALALLRANSTVAGVLLSSLTAALLATVVLRIRNAHYRRLCAEEERDDCYQDGS